jgi:hypothetical protein
MEMPSVRVKKAVSARKKAIKKSSWRFGNVPSAKD